MQVPHGRAAFLEASLRLRRLRKPSKPRVRLKSMSTALRSASRAFPLVTIHREVVDRGACHIGQVASLDSRRVALLEIDPGAEWDQEPTLYRLSEITRVDFGGGYEEALALVGGTRLTNKTIKRGRARTLKATNAAGLREPRRSGTAAGSRSPTRWRAVRR